MDRLPYYHILHLLSLIVLTAQTFMAFANPLPENRKRTMVIAIIAFGLEFVIRRIERVLVPWAGRD